MSFRLIGALMICLGAASFGFSASGKVRKTGKTLQQLKQSLERMRCEVSYTHTPAGQVCEIVSAGTDGEVLRFYKKLSGVFQGAYPTQTDWADKLVTQTFSCLPVQVSEAMTELISSFGRFGLEEQLRLIDLTTDRVDAALGSIDAEKKDRCRCYETLGICTGLAVAILVL